MGIKYKTTINKIPELKSNVRSLNKKRVKIGALNGSHAYLAAIHEYG